MHMASNTEVRTWSFLSLLVGGILIVVGGLMGALTMGAFGWMGMMPTGGMMDTYMDDVWLTNMAWWIGGVGLLSGGVILVAASRIYRDRDVALWSIVAIAAGALSLFAMGGFVLGAVLAIAGGALALVETQQKTPRVRRA